MYRKERRYNAERKRGAKGYGGVQGSGRVGVVKEKGANCHTDEVVLDVQENHKRPCGGFKTGCART